MLRLMLRRRLRLRLRLMLWRGLRLRLGLRPGLIMCSHAGLIIRHTEAQQGFTKNRVVAES